MVTEINRVKVDTGDKVLVTTTSGAELFDHVVLCSSAKVCRSILKNQSKLEKYCLNNIRFEYIQSHTHSDDKFIPKIDSLRNFHYGVKIRDKENIMEYSYFVDK